MLIEKDIKTKKYLNLSNLISIFIIIISFILDRISKNYIINSDLNNIFITDYLNLNLVWNTGIGFGLFATEANIVYHLISFFIFCIIIFIIFVAFKEEIISKISYALIIGGAFGNLFDRVTLFAVPDFIDLHYNNYHWFTFNIADIFVTIGVILIIIAEIFKNHK